MQKVPGIFEEVKRDKVRAQQSAEHLNPYGKHAEDLRTSDSMVKRARDAAGCEGQGVRSTTWWVQGVHGRGMQYAQRERKEVAKVRGLRQGGKHATRTRTRVHEHGRTSVEGKTERKEYPIRALGFLREA